MQLVVTLLFSLLLIGCSTPDPDDPAARATALANTTFLRGLNTPTTVPAKSSPAPPPNVGRSRQEPAPFGMTVLTDSGLEVTLLEALRTPADPGTIRLRVGLRCGSDPSRLCRPDTEFAAVTQTGDVSQ